jgi:hypothetical protein
VKEAVAVGFSSITGNSNISPKTRVNAVPASKITISRNFFTIAASKNKRTSVIGAFFMPLLNLNTVP